MNRFNPLSSPADSWPEETTRPNRRSPGSMPSSRASRRSAIIYRNHLNHHLRQSDGSGKTGRETRDLLCAGGQRSLAHETGGHHGPRPGVGRASFSHDHFPISKLSRPFDLSPAGNFRLHPLPPANRVIPRGKLCGVHRTRDTATVIASAYSCPEWQFPPQSGRPSVP